MTNLRDYQKVAVDQTVKLLNEDNRVILVSPTGSGKTRMAAEVVSLARDADAACFAVSHRHEINEQLRDRLGVQVQTIQTLCREEDPKLFDHIDLVVFDECHHVAAEKWSRAQKLFRNARVLGLSATPVRSDGAPLGNWFDEMVVAAQYPELVRDGHLCPVKIIRPDACTAPDISLDPVKAYKKYVPGERAFLYAGTVEQAESISKRFNESGIPSATISGGTPEDERRLSLKLFRELGVQVLCSVFVLTEGVDVPEASACILARGCSNPSTYLQMVGRVLRPHKDKKWASLLDLTGVSWIHGSPIAERRYSLDKGIELAASVQVVDCPQCAWCGPSNTWRCPVCEWNFKENSGKKRKPLIMSERLKEVYAGVDTPLEAKAEEFAHLCYVAKEKGYSIGWALRKYKDLFDELPYLDKGDKQLILEEEVARASARGHKIGSAIYRYQDLLDEKPDWNFWSKLKRKYG